MAHKNLDGSTVLSIDDQLFEYGNSVITNLDPLGPGQVRVNVQIGAHPSAGITETAALYIRVNHGATWDTEDRFSGGIYGEVDQYQFLAGAGFSKVIHRGWGDAHFVAIMATGDLVPIANVTNTSPPQVTTSRKHGMGHNNTVMISGVVGATGVNADAWYGTRIIDEYTIELYDDVGDPAPAPGAYVSGGQVTCINSPVGYEAATFAERFSGITDNRIGRANGAVGFLASVQAGFPPVPGVTPWPSGLDRWKGFEALVENDQLLVGACFIASDVPNNAFLVSKRQYFQDDEAPLGVVGTTSGSQTMFAIKEAYYHPQADDGSAIAAMDRWVVQADGTVKTHSLLASAGTTTRSAASIYQFGSYWDGADPIEYGLRHHLDLTGTAAANYDLLFGVAGAEAAKFRFKSDGDLQMLGGRLDLQAHAILSCSGLTMSTGAAAPTQIDLQTNYGVGGQVGEIVGMAGIQTPVGTGGAIFYVKNQLTGLSMAELKHPSTNDVSALQLQVKVGGLFYTTPVLLGAAGSGPGGGTERALYVDVGA